MIFNACVTRGTAVHGGTVRSSDQTHPSPATEFEVIFSWWKVNSYGSKRDLYSWGVSPPRPHRDPSPSAFFATVVAIVLIGVLYEYLQYLRWQLDKKYASLKRPYSMDAHSSDENLPIMGAGKHHRSPAATSPLDEADPSALQAGVPRVQIITSAQSSKSGSDDSLHHVNGFLWQLREIRPPSRTTLIARSSATGACRKREVG